MVKNLLITGAAGYIGGSILANFVDQTDGLAESAIVHAVVRTEEQAKSLGDLRANVICLDLSDQASIEEVVLSNEIDIILHVASSHDPKTVSDLLRALGKRRNISGIETFFVHTSGTTAFAPEAGWPAVAMRDTDNVFAVEKEISAVHPIRLTDVAVVEEGEAQGVTTFIVVVPSVYGRGLGECKKLSIAFPTFIRASIRNKVVHQFDVSGSPAAVHISDIVAFYRLLTEHMLQNKSLPSGKDGYFFPMAHQVSSWNLMQRFAERLHARGLVGEPKPRTWPSDEVAAESLGIPLPIVRIMGTHRTDLIPAKPYELGWKPLWDEKMLLDNIDQEINDVLEEDGAKIGST